MENCEKCGAPLGKCPTCGETRILYKEQHFAPDHSTPGGQVVADVYVCINGHPFQGDFNKVEPTP